MELAFVIYLIDNITALKDHIFGLSDFIFLTIILLGFLITGIGSLIVFALLEMSMEEFKESVIYTFYKKIIKSWFYILLPLCFLGTALNVILPSKDTAYKMLAAYGLQEIVEAASKSEDVKRLASKSLTLIEKSIDDYTKSLDKTETQEDNSSTEDKKD